CRNFTWNVNARRFAIIELVVYTVSYETRQAELLRPPLSRQSEPNATTYNYVLEMDGRGTILGGEWLSSPTGTGPNNKEVHPDFLFMSVQAESLSESADDRGGRVDNPYLSSLRVRELLRLSRTQAPTRP
ncbi:MAG TPA: hypothetical protein PKA58_22425, partial [Polyangium sp.]|nr:hypothetical protein [Polyangium sp.]